MRREYDAGGGVKGDNGDSLSRGSTAIGDEVFSRSELDLGGVLNSAAGSSGCWERGTSAGCEEGSERVSTSSNRPGDEDKSPIDDDLGGDVATMGNSSDEDTGDGVSSPCRVVASA